MAIHLFSTPVECTHCGAVVNDPTLDRCPDCGRLLRERRTPGRLAGVERRYGDVRVLVGVLRFLSVVTIALAVLIVLFATGEDGITLTQRLGLLLGAALIGTVFLAAAAFFNVALDVEENTRASFRVQQMLLDRLERQTTATDAADAAAGTRGAS